MEKMDEFIINSYEKILKYLNEAWLNSVKNIKEFDFMILAKVGSIILFGYILAVILSKYIPKGIKALGKKFGININQEFTIALRSFIFKVIFFLFMLIVVKVLELPDNIAFIASAIIKSILILSIIGFSLKISKLLLTNMANQPRAKKDEDSVKIVQQSTLPLFENTALIVFSLGGVYQVFAIWNVDMTALLAGAGIGAMAVGMAAKDTLSDIIAGILILSGAPYRVGDVVYIRDNLKGRVTQIGLRNTRLVTRNNIEIIVPNTIMGTSQIVNESSSKEMGGIRIQLDISTASDENIAQIKSILVDAAKETRLISKNKYIKSFMTGFEQDIIHFKVQCWIDNPEDKGYAKGELIEKIYLKLDEAGIDVTMTREQISTISIKELPSQELHITQFPDTKQEQLIKEFPDTQQTHFIKEFPHTKQTHFVKEFPDTRQEHWVREFPHTKQTHFVKEFPDTRQEHWVREFPHTKQTHFVKEFPDTKQEHWVREFPHTKQTHFVKEFPNTKQEHWVREFPHTKQTHFVKEFPDTKQEQFVKEFPDTKQEQFIKEFPNTKQDISIKEFPDTKQEQFVKEFPDTKQDMSIKEIPNLFGSGVPKQRATSIKKTSVDRNIMKNIKKDRDEK